MIAQPLADDHSDGYIADRLYWDSMEAGPACPCSPTVMDSEPGQDFASTPMPGLDCDQSADDVALELSDAISIATLHQRSANSEPYKPLEDAGWEATGVEFPPAPPQLPVQSEDIRPEDATDYSVPSLDDLREGKSDTMACLAL